MSGNDLEGAYEALTRVASAAAKREARYQRVAHEAEALIAVIQPPERVDTDPRLRPLQDALDALKERE